MASSLCESANGRSSVSESDDSSTTGSVPSLLDRLKVPLRSELTRKPVIRTNSGHGSVSKRRPSCSTNPKSVTPSSRVREFPDKHLKVSAGVLFCGVCREELSTKRSIIANHVTSAKHKLSKLKLDKQREGYC